MCRDPNALAASRDVRDEAGKNVSIAVEGPADVVAPTN